MSESKTVEGLADRVVDLIAEGKEKDTEIARLRRALEGVKDWAIRSDASGLAQWCSEALNPTGAVTVLQPGPVPAPDPHDATIKALADALWESGDEYANVGWHTNSCIMDRSNGKEECTPTCESRRAALRLAGRLP